MPHGGWKSNRRLIGIGFRVLLGIFGCSETSLTTKYQMQIKQSSASLSLVFFMVDSTDHVTGKTGLTPTVTLSKNGAAFASPAGAVSEIANGFYNAAANATDSNTLGILALTATGTGADRCAMAYEIVANLEADSIAAIAALNNLSAGGVRTELSTELGRIDAAISSRNATTPPTAAAVATQVRAELGTELARIDAAISTRNATTPDNASITAIKGKTDNLPSDPADHSLIMAAIPSIEDIIGAAGGLTVETVAKLEAADQIFLAAPYEPDESPVLVIPAPDTDESLTVVYAHTENVINVKRAGIVLTFKLVTVPAKSERILEVAAVTATTDADGYAQITLQSDLRYRVTCRALGLEKIFTPTGETLNLLTLIA